MRISGLWKKLKYGLRGKSWLNRLGQKKKFTVGQDPKNKLIEIIF